MICRLFTEDNKSRTYQHENAVFLLRHAMLAAYGVHKKYLPLSPHCLDKPDLHHVWRHFFCNPYAS